MKVRLLVGLIAALALGIFTVSTVNAQDPDVRDLVNAASGLYELGDYRGAAVAYEDVVALGVKDPVLYYNLGVAYMQTDRPGPAVLNFRRALALDPSDADAAANLKIARESLEGVLPPSGSGLTGFSNAVVSVAPAWLLGAGAILASIVAAVLWAVFRMARSRVFKDSTAYAATVLLLLVGFSVAVLVIDAGRDRGDAVVPRTASLYSGPGPGYVDFLSVPAGAEVSIVDQRDEWVRLALPPGDYGEGVQGWAKSATVELELP